MIEIEKMRRWGTFINEVTLVGNVTRNDTCQLAMTGVI